MVEMDFIVLEDDLEYAIVDEITINNVKYIYLINEDNNTVKLRKLNEEEDLLEITDSQEHDKAMLEFMKKHRNDFS